MMLGQILLATLIVSLISLIGEVIIKPWHGIPRENIKWHPTVDESKCIGCGMCVTGCGRKVYGFDYKKKKSVVLRPDNCMVACVTCANTWFWKQ